MKYSLIIFILILIPRQQFSQVSGRDVAWAHGLGESGQNVWEYYRYIFKTEREMDGQNTDYYTSAGINYASSDLKSVWIHNSNVNPTDAENIGIGHSLGGLVLRDIDRDYSATYFGGLITVGTPNNGAYIVNSINNGDVEDAIANGTSKMLAGPTAEITSLLPFAGLGAFLNAFLDPLISDAITDKILGIFKPIQSTQTFTDLTASGSYVNALNNYSSTIPRISVYGSENSPVHWRVASSFASDRETDRTYVDIARNAEAVYEIFTLLNASQTILSGISCIFHPVSCFLAVSHAHRAIQWNKGRVWLNQSENMWLALINCNEFSSTVEHITITSIVHHECEQYEPGSHDWMVCLYQYCDGDINSGCVEEIELPYVATIGKRSDGLVSGATQIGNYVTEDYRYEALGVNHAEETNTSTGTTENGNDEMRSVFNLIWDRDDFFHTEKR
jgi:hypothetical protein